MGINHDVIREQIDKLRFDVRSGVIGQEQSYLALTDKTSQCIAGSATRTSQFPESHLGGALHMCPWHTCQGTRISPDATST